MRTDVRMRCFYHTTAFPGEKNHLWTQLLDWTIAGLIWAELSVRINHKTRLIKFMCAKLCWWNWAHCSRYAKRITVGRKTPAYPLPPWATEQLSKSQQLSFTLSLSSSITEALEDVHTEETDPVGAGVQSLVALVPLPAPAHSMCPFPWDVPISHSQSSMHMADRCFFPSGLPDLLCQTLGTPMCFFVPAVTRRTFATTPFSERKPHVWPLQGVGCPATHLRH